MEVMEQEFKQEALTLKEQVTAISVTNIETYASAGELGKNIKTLREKVVDYFKPLKDAAFKAHKTITAKEAEELGAGEILLTSMETDGTRDGFDLAITSAISDAAGIPVIASGGVGTLEHFYDGFVKGKADACLAASVFHYGEFTVKDVKEYLRARDIPVRL